jgi:CheY-like chemotaxis protein
MKPLTILVVEDNDLNRKLVRELLRRRGHVVVEAIDVEEARERLGESTPDLVLADIEIPGGGGEVLLAEMRAVPHLARVPVIAVTAAAMVGDRERFLEKRFDGYIAKPIDTRTFCRDVESYASEGG